MSRHLGLLLFLLTGCATISPRFEQDVAASFAADHMRKLETADLELYYPEEYAEAAKHVAARASECVALMRRNDVTQRDYGKVLLFLTSANFNNAYVGGQQQGEPLHSLNPLSATDELFALYDLGGADVGDIACHEMFHYVHFEQTHGFWRVINAIFGPVVPPQAFLERWFTEGVAQYYEGRLLRRVGRPWSPFYRGAFDSFVALRGGDVEPGDLQLNQRQLNPHSGAYLTGLHFVEWLAARYGEDKLWALMELQGQSVFSPLGYTLRFKAIYGLSVGALMDTWRAELKRDFKARQRPETEQILLPDVGQGVRVATHAGSGVTALVSSGNEQVPLLRILEADGRVRVERHLVQLFPTRSWVYVGPYSMSGLSFSADGKRLFLLNDDLIARGDTRAQLWTLDAQTGEVLEVVQDLGRGMGGSISADGRRYVFVDLPPGHARLVERDLETGLDTVLVEAAPGVTLGAPSWNPSHTRLVWAQFEGAGWNLMQRTADGVTTALTHDGNFNYGPRWADDTHLVFERTAGRYLQAHRMNVEQPESIERLTDAPWGVLDPMPSPQGVVFAARDGVHWSIDRAPDTALEAIALQPVETPIAPPHVAPALLVEHDEAYSSLDHLFLPQLRAPSIVGFSGTSLSTFNLAISASLMGRDRLGKHSWILSGSMYVPDYGTNSVSAAYRNLTLAPWNIVAYAERDQFSASDTLPITVYWTGGVSVGRSIFTAPVSLGVQTEVLQPYGYAIQKYVGPSLSVAWASSESTSYGGAQRALAFSLDVAGYPKIFGSDRDLLDVRPAVSFALPVPFSSRHSFVASATGRFLPGAPDGALRLGGVPAWNTLYRNPSNTMSPPGPGTYLPGTLVEGLRGYDDYALRAKYAGIFGARYRYNFIVDRGTASFLYLFPSFFFRQVDVELFGSGAITETQSAKAAGAAVYVRMSFGGVLPVTLLYQFAWRFDFGLPPLHVVAVSFE